MKKVIAIILALLIMAFSFTGCVSFFKDGVVNVYTADGKLFATYEGATNIYSEGDCYVKFDLNGKEYFYYNCFVEVIA